MLSEKAKQIADEAEKRGHWLYDPGYRKWYSPEEFKHIFSCANANDDFLNAVQIRHPNEGIEAGFKKLNELGERLRIFSLKVVEYYNK
jgi:hypothetical protein